MPDSDTLLAYLVPRITSRVEDTATDALAFILNKSESCQGALNRLLREGGFDLEPIVRFETQVTYEDGSRPDMNGHDKEGRKRLLVESKFWASLLQGQASGYFDQLEEKGPGLLLFIAPESRLITLWAEIERQMADAGRAVELIESQENFRKARVADSKIGLMLISWSLLLRHMEDSVSGDSPVASDIKQLRGLAQRQDKEAFLPIHAEELAPALPRRIQGINRLIDDAIRQGRLEIDITTQGLRRTPQRQGYGRYFRFKDVPGDLFLCVNYGMWSSSADTPLWLWIGGHVPVDASKLKGRFPSTKEYEGYGTFDVPIHLKTGVEYRAILDNVVSQIREIKNCIGTSN